MTLQASLFAPAREHSSPLPTEREESRDGYVLSIFGPNRGLIRRTDCLSHIADEVASSYRVSVDDLKGPRRTRRVAQPRHEAFYRAYATGRFSLDQIGSFFGGRDHSTVWHGLRAHMARMVTGVAA